MESLPDEALLQRIALQDEAAFGVFYDRHGRLAYSLACRILGDTAEAEDVVQEAFLRVWRMAGSFDTQRGNARTWLLSVVHHRSIDMVRRRRGQPLPGLVSEANQPSTAASHVWNEVSIVLDREAIKAALRQIPSEQKQAIELAYFGGFTHQQIAQLAQLPLGTVKGRIRMGMEKLRGLLKDPEMGA